jgi:hypothetical protein
MLEETKKMIVFLEKHAHFEDLFLLPRIGCAVPVVSLRERMSGT